MAWLLTLTIGMITAAWLPVAGMTLVVPSLLSPTLGSVALMLLSRFYSRRRPRLRIAALARTMAELIAYVAVAAVLSYLVTTLNRPLIDDQLVAADRTLGLDWPAMYGWIAAHPRLHDVLCLAYASLIPQMILLQVVLHFRGDIERGRELTWLLIATSLGCILLSGPFPAVGAFGYFHTEIDQPYVQQFLALRDGTLRAIDLGRAEGLVQCPSLHLALALVFVYAARGLRVLFPCILLLNLLVIAATPAVGGHHFADLWAGGALTALALVGVRAARDGRSAPFSTSLRTRGDNGASDAKTQENPSCR
jgi:hypothetical protein